MDCQNISEKIKNLLDEIGIRKSEAEVHVKQIGEMCACDVDFKSSLLRLSIMNVLKERLEAEGYSVDADVASQCYKAEKPLGLRMNIWEKR